MDIASIRGRQIIQEADDLTVPASDALEEFMDETLVDELPNDAPSNLETEVYHVYYFP
jgi:hypothetical protein